MNYHKSRGRVGTHIHTHTAIQRCSYHRENAYTQENTVKMNPGPEQCVCEREMGTEINKYRGITKVLRLIGMTVYGRSKRVCVRVCERMFCFCIEHTHTKTDG